MYIYLCKYVCIYINKCVCVSIYIYIVYIYIVCYIIHWIYRSIDLSIHRSIDPSIYGSIVVSIFLFTAIEPSVLFNLLLAGSRGSCALLKAMVVIFR